VAEAYHGEATTKKELWGWCTIERAKKKKKKKKKKIFFFFKLEQSNQTGLSHGCHLLLLDFCKFLRSFMNVKSNLSICHCDACLPTVDDIANSTFGNTTMSAFLVR
jgi:hypothetical protein